MCLQTSGKRPSGSGVSFDADVADDASSVFAFPPEVQQGYNRPLSISPCLSVGSPIFRSRKMSSSLQYSDRDSLGDLHGVRSSGGIASRGSKESMGGGAESELSNAECDESKRPTRHHGIDASTGARIDTGAGAVRCVGNGAATSLPISVRDADKLSHTSSKTGRCEALYS